MNAKKNFKYIGIIVLSVLIVYIFLAVKPLHEELSFNPEWTISLDSIPSQGTSQNSGGMDSDADSLIPFNVGGVLGFVSGKGNLTNLKDIRYEGTIGNNMYALYSQTQKATNFYNSSDELILTINDSGFPYITDNKIYIFSPGGDSVTAYDFSGNIIWERQNSDVITAFNDSESGTIIGYSNGQLVYIDNNGKTVFSFIPGGSKYPVIFGAALSDDGKYAACISGVENQRFVLIGINNKQFKIIYHEYLPEDLKTNLIVHFDNKTENVYYQRTDGLGVVSLKSKNFHLLPVEGMVVYIGSDSSNLTAALSKTKEGKSVVSIFENPYYLLARTVFECDDSALIQKGNSIYLGIDKTLSKINLLEQ